MAIIPLPPNPVSAVLLIPEFVRVADRLLSAYETSKRLDYEMAALEVNYKLSKQKLQIEREVLLHKHKEAMQQFINEKNILTQLVKDCQTSSEEFSKNQQMLRETSKRICDAILADNTNSQRRQELMQFYNSIFEHLENNVKIHIASGKELHKIIQNTTMKQLHDNNNRRLEG